LVSIPQMNLTATKNDTNTDIHRAAIFTFRKSAKAEDSSCFGLSFVRPSVRPQLRYENDGSDWMDSSSSSVALQLGVGLRLLYNTPPSLRIPCSVSPFVYSHLPEVRGHVIQPSHFWSSSSSCFIQLSVHLFLDCAVLHSFYMAKPSYFLEFNKPDNVPHSMDYYIYNWRIWKQSLCRKYIFD